VAYFFAKHDVLSTMKFKDTEVLGGVRKLILYSMYVRKWRAVDDGNIHSFLDSSSVFRMSHLDLGGGLVQDTDPVFLNPCPWIFDNFFGEVAGVKGWQAKGKTVRSVVLARGQHCSQQRFEISDHFQILADRT